MNATNTTNTTTNTTTNMSTSSVGDSGGYAADTVFDRELPTVLLISIFLLMVCCTLVAIVHVRICKRVMMPRAQTFSSFEFIASTQVACDTEDASEQPPPDVEAIEIFNTEVECNENFP